MPSWRVMLAADLHGEDLGLGTWGALSVLVLSGFEIPMGIANVLRREERRADFGCVMVAFRMGTDLCWKWGMIFCV